MAHDVTTFRSHVEDFLSQTQVARLVSEKCRDYVNGHQWTLEEEERLRARGQAPIVINRVAPKLRGLKGLLVQRKTDPKAYPRSQAHEETAHAVTDALRFVADNVDFDDIKLDVSEDVFVEGYGGAIVGISQSRDQIEIEVTRIPWDRIYYDPHSRKNNYKDARYMGIIVWMDVENARELFGDVVDQCASNEGSEAETFDDRPRWKLGTEKRQRLRIAQEFYLDEGTWHTVIFCGDTFIMEPMPSPYLDEDGEPMNPIELASAYVDRDNDRFGEVYYWLSLQDEINHRRSKALYLLSVRQTAGSKGAVPDIAAMKRELSKADGHVEYQGDAGAWEVLPTGDMAQAQFELLQHATAEMDAVGFNAQLAGERQGNLSGKAIQTLQSAGANELLDIFNRLNGWEKRIYRQIWLRIRQYWDRERWVRVTDEERNLRWVGFNVELTAAQVLQEKAEDQTRDEETRTRAAQILEELTQAQDPRLQQPMMMRNPIAELDVDIVLDQVLDTVSVQHEQFELMTRVAQSSPPGTVSFADLLRLMPGLRNKDELIKKIEDREQQAAQIAAQSVEVEAAQEQEKMRGEVEKGLILQNQEIEGRRELEELKIAGARETKIVEEVLR